LTGNCITSLVSIDALDSFPALSTLRLTHTDISEAAATLIKSAADSSVSPPPLGPSEARQLIIGRCPRISTINGSEVRAREREDAEKAYARRISASFAAAEGASGGITSIFGAKLAPEAAAANPYGAQNMGVYSGGSSSLDADAAHIALAQVSKGKTTLAVDAPLGFSKGSDQGVIRGRAPAVDRESVFVTSPTPLFLVSLGAGEGSDKLPILSPPPYVSVLDPWGLGAENPPKAALLQRLAPRYFLLAARYELHAPAVAAAAGSGALANSVAALLLRSMAGGSCMLEPQTKRLPLSTEVGALRQLCAKLFRAQDASLLRLSFRERGDAAALPALLEDDLKPLSYYGVPPEGAEVLIEEVDPAEAARQRAAEAARLEARAREQEAQGEALRRANELGVGAQKKGAAAGAAVT